MSSPTITPAHDYVLTLSCPDGPGIVAAVTTLLARSGGNILQSQQYDDLETGTFFMRVQFREISTDPIGLDRLGAAFGPLATEYRMTWELVDANVRPRLLLMVSKFGHCLNDLLFRISIGALPADPVAVVSNHPDFGRLADNYGVPFHHIPVTADSKSEAEARLLELVDETTADLVVLARYMQVLSNDLCKHLEGRAINIHHSMLPSFKGAKPYHRAHERGVKLVGATAHYVTAGLDEGPIIEQEVARVNHTMTADDLVAVGRDVECQALARAVRWHCEHRVILNGMRTVVLQ